MLLRQYRTELVRCCLNENDLERRVGMNNNESENGFFACYLSMWKRIFDFKGRSTKKEFWCPFAVNSAFAAVLAGIMLLTHAAEAALAVRIIILSLFGLYFVAALIPCISLTVRRLHDVGRSGWWYFLIFAVGVGAIALLIICSAASAFRAEENMAVCVYGPPPDYMYTSEAEQTTSDDEFDPAENVAVLVYGPPDAFTEPEQTGEESVKLEFIPPDNIPAPVYGPPPSDEDISSEGE